MQQTFADHLAELRVRLLGIVGFSLIVGAIAYIFHNSLSTFLQRPFGQTLYYNSPAGGFNFVMKLCFLVALAVSIPLIIYNGVRFVEPAFEYKRIGRGKLLLLVVISLMLLMIGGAFGYFVMLPVALHFFSQYSTSQIQPLITADSYLNFTLACIVTFALFFQLPLIIAIIDRMTPLPPSKLLHYQRHVIVGSLLLAVILPFTYDPVTQFIMAAPLIVLYYLSILGLVLFGRSRKQQKAHHKAVIRQPKHQRNQAFQEQSSNLSQGGSQIAAQPASLPVTDLRPAHFVNNGHTLDLRKTPHKS